MPSCRRLLMQRVELAFRRAEFKTGKSKPAMTVIATMTSSSSSRVKAFTRSRTDSATTTLFPTRAFGSAPCPNKSSEDISRWDSRFSGEAADMFTNQKKDATCQQVSNHQLE